MLVSSSASAPHIERRDVLKEISDEVQNYSESELLRWMQHYAELDKSEAQNKLKSPYCPGAPLELAHHRHCVRTCYQQMLDEASKQAGKKRQ